jgi:hypothetical protein
VAPWDGDAQEDHLQNVGSNQENNGVRQFSFCCSMDDIW